LQPFRTPIKPLGHAVLLFRHQTRVLNVMSGLSGGFASIVLEHKKRLAQLSQPFF
jgi:hypothetical protein